VELDAEQIRAAIHYNPETGIFTRLTRASNMPPGSTAGTLDAKEGYVVVRVLGKRFLAHRLAWLYMTGNWPAQEVDHINRVRNDNRWENLRDVSRATNALNRRAVQANRQGCVYWDGRKGGRWYGMFSHKKQKYYAGSSRCRDEAIRLLNEKRREVLSDSAGV
jgi:hypothetical protein